MLAWISFIWHLAGALPLEEGAVYRSMGDLDGFIATVQVTGPENEVTLSLKLRWMLLDISCPNLLLKFYEGRAYSVQVAYFDFKTDPCLSETRKFVPFPPESVPLEYNSASDLFHLDIIFPTILSRVSDNVAFDWDTSSFSPPRQADQVSLPETAVYDFAIGSVQAQITVLDDKNTVHFRLSIPNEPTVSCVLDLDFFIEGAVASVDIFPDSDICLRKVRGRGRRLLGQIFTLTYDPAIDEFTAPLTATFTRRPRPSTMGRIKLVAAPSPWADDQEEKRS